MFKRSQQRLSLIDLVGKCQKVRSIPLETPIKQGIDEWLAAAKVKGLVVVPANSKNGKVWGNRLDESAIWEIVRHYARQWDAPTSTPRRQPDVRPHRRLFG